MDGDQLLIKGLVGAKPILTFRDVRAITSKGTVVSITVGSGLQFRFTFKGATEADLAAIKTELTGRTGIGIHELRPPLISQDTAIRIGLAVVGAFFLLAVTGAQPVVGILIGLAIIAAAGVHLAGRLARGGLDLLLGVEPQKRTTAKLASVGQAAFGLLLLVAAIGVILADREEAREQEERAEQRRITAAAEQDRIGSAIELARGRLEASQRAGDVGDFRASATALSEARGSISEWYGRNPRPRAISAFLAQCEEHSRTVGPQHVSRALSRSSSVDPTNTVTAVAALELAHTLLEEHATYARNCPELEAFRAQVSSRAAEILVPQITPIVEITKQALEAERFEEALQAYSQSDSLMAQVSNFAPESAELTTLLAEVSEGLQLARDVVAARRVVQQCGERLATAENLAGTGRHSEAQRTLSQALRNLRGISAEAREYVETEDLTEDLNTALYTNQVAIAESRAQQGRDLVASGTVLAGDEKFGEAIAMLEEIPDEYQRASGASRKLRSLRRERRRHERALEQEVERQIAQALCGERPRDHNDAVIEYYFRQFAHDPGSVDISRCTRPRWDDDACWVTECDLRARNAFGALVLHRVRVSLVTDDGMVAAVAHEERHML